MAETLANIFAKGRAALTEAGIATAALDARLLLQHAAEMDHAEFILNMNAILIPEAADEYDWMIKERLKHRPVSRIIGEREFYGRRFYIEDSVLDPRPDTETLIELAMEVMPKDLILTVADMGCGSGAIIVTLLAENPHWEGVAVDVSEDALDIMWENAEAHGVEEQLEAYHSSWFEKIEWPLDLIVSNPPYIPTGDIAVLSPDVRNFDPHLALDGGSDGLSCYRILAEGAASYLCEEGAIVVEIGAGQAADVERIFDENGFRLKDSKNDLGGHVRALAFVYKDGVSPKIDWNQRLDELRPSLQSLPL